VFLGSGNEYLALAISWVAMISMLPCVLAMERPGTSIALHGTALVATAASQVQTTRPGMARSNELDVKMAPNRPMHSTTTYLLSFSAAFYLVGTLIYAYIKALYPFVYPLALNEGEFHHTSFIL